MHFCQKNELEVEKSSETQRKEEFQTICTYPNEKREKHHVCTLLNISDLSLEQERSMDYIIGAGWDEAVRGWGKASPTACLWPRRKSRKAKAGESDSQCLLCVNMVHPPGSHLVPDPPKPNLKARSGVTRDTVPEKERAPLPNQEPPARSETATGEASAGKIVSSPQSLGEKKSLQIKEYIWHPEKPKAPESTKHREPRSHEPTVSNPKPDPGLSDASKPGLVLPPLRAGPQSSLDSSIKKKMGTLTVSEEKTPGPENAWSYGSKAAEPKGGKGTLDHLSGVPGQRVKLSEASPRTSFSCEPTPPGCWPWPLLPYKHSTSVPNVANAGKIDYLTTWQFPPKRRLQGLRPQIRREEPRAASGGKEQSLSEAQRDSGSQAAEARLLAGQLFPSLTVSRVIIPVLPHRLL
ncbi:uncharacterized protein C16orf46 homolog [Tachyglossus aculeatus]|uniref:uncharacterized protein C16orf46 homolog n=1 Tax=Tachyglossus aculeatus TaxID=9261 RepID=UPI0018F441B7|nr:uncharacterized protein C16orf46 homolog [Tachyglossus aculeatus]XP_038610356.1 uncharacterized protein C16orf46 homolog [Tachyglossus aculeatus]